VLLVPARLARAVPGLWRAHALARNARWRMRDRGADGGDGRGEEGVMGGRGSARGWGCGEGAWSFGTAMISSARRSWRDGGGVDGVGE